MRWRKPAVTRSRCWHTAMGPGRISAAAGWSICCLGKTNIAEPSRCSRRGRHDGIPDHEASSAGPAAELCRSATGGATRMGLLDWFRRLPQAAAPEPAEQHVVKNVPALSDPILLFMESPAFVTGLAAVPSWQVVHVRSFGEFSAA